MTSHRIKSGLALALATASFSAAAATYYCDNDRDAGQYPYCTVYEGWDPAPTHHIAWSYRSGQANDWNGDDRVNSHAGQYYVWQFSKQGTFRWSAWLDNNAFTDPRARYTVASYSSSSGWHNTIIATINQNTARAGWNPLGSKAVYGREIDVRASGSHTAGADIVRASTASAAAASGGTLLQAQAPGTPASVLRLPTTPARPMDPAIAAIHARMLGATAHYRDVQGSYDVLFANSGQDESVRFASSQSRRASATDVVDHATNRTVRYVSDGVGLKVIDLASRSYTVEDLPTDQGRSAEAAPASRVYLDDTDTPVYVHRIDPAGAIGASDVLNPENYAFWLDGSDARVADHAVVLGRKASVIVGHHDDYLRGKLGATTFRMWVDDATGVLLRLVGTDAGGAVVYAIDVRDIRFDAGIADLPARLAVPVGFARVAAQHSGSAPR